MRQDAQGRAGGGLRRIPLFRRLERVGTATEAEVRSRFCPRLWEVLAVSAWCGLATGLVEITVLLIRGRLQGPAASGVLHLNRQYVWMIPAANLGVFLAAGLALGLVGLVAGRNRLSDRPLWFLMLSLFGLAMLWPIKAIHSGASAALAVGLAARGSALAVRRGRRLAGMMCTTLPVGLMLLTGRFVWEQERAWKGEGRELAQLVPAGDSSENVMLIVLDTVRADHLSLYGYGRPTTPNLDRIARERAIVFDFARSPAPWTLPAHATLFTGRWPHEVEVSEKAPYDGRYPTLAEQLRSRGYATAGFVSNMYYLNRWYGLHRGFVHFEDYPEHHGVSVREVLRNAELGRRVLGWLGLRSHTRAGDFGVRKQAEDINRHLLTWLDQTGLGRDDRPFFVFLNYLDAHDPYIVPPGKITPFGAAGDPNHVDALRNWHRVARRDVSEETRRLMIDAYDSCLAYLDLALGELIAELDQRGLTDSTWIIITSDHGEHLGEHDLYLHGHSLYRPLIDVPLVVLPPRSRGLTPARIGRAVNTREIPRTIAELVGLEDREVFPGRSLARFWERPDASGLDDESPVFSEADLGIRPKPGKPVRARAPVARGPMQALATERHTYIKLGDGSEQLYELATDPAEERNRSGDPSEAARIEAFRRSLREQLRH
ncbi:MAG: hypothetical protein KatS3mg108_1149 [Isosphaeraceae bacterium]|jgi:arylsulfatase A-like enzyme|nr:MAG: hypothetical protein KatS3mg108_1149 [Isosphaeraceae bacterium]